MDGFDHHQLPYKSRPHATMEGLVSLSVLLYLDLSRLSGHLLSFVTVLFTSLFLCFNSTPLARCRIPQAPQRSRALSTTPRTLQMEKTPQIKAAMSFLYVISAPAPQRTRISCRILADLLVQRIFTYGRPIDYVLEIIGILAAIGSGVAMVMVNVVLGKFITLLDGVSSTGTVSDNFMSSVGKSA